MTQLNYFIIRETILKAEKPLDSKTIWLRGMKKNPSLAYTTTKLLLKKIAQNNSSGVTRVEVKGLGRGGIKYLYCAQDSNINERNN